MTTIFWISLGLSAARWALTEFQRWRDRGVIKLQERVILELKERNATLAMEAVVREKAIRELQSQAVDELQTKRNLLQRLESIKEVVG